jgi:hypothetical protein
MPFGSGFSYRYGFRHHAVTGLFAVWTMPLPFRSAGTGMGQEPSSLYTSFPRHRAPDARKVSSALP